MADLDELTRKVKKFTEERCWEKFHNPKDLALALVLEAAEVLEPFRFKTDIENKDELAKELCDVLNVVLLLADNLSIDLDYWFDKKLEEIAQKYPIEKFRGKNLKYSEKG